jgi:hypothetical protein
LIEKKAKNYSQTYIPPSSLLMECPELPTIRGGRGFVCPITKESYIIIIIIPLEPASVVHTHEV